MRKMTFAQATLEAMAEEMCSDSSKGWDRSFRAE